MIWHFRVRRVCRGSGLPAGSFPWSCWAILPLFYHLSSNSLDEEEQNVFISIIWSCCQVCFRYHSTQNIKPCTLVSSHQGLTLTLLPTVAVCRGTGPLQLAVMALVAHPRTLGAATERLCKTTGATLEDVLIDVFSSCPGEGTSVIAADNM